MTRFVNLKAVIKEGTTLPPLSTLNQSSFSGENILSTINHIFRQSAVEFSDDVKLFSLLAHDVR